MYLNFIQNIAIKKISVVLVNTSFKSSIVCKPKPDSSQKWCSNITKVIILIYNLL